MVSLNCILVGHTCTLVMKRVVPSVNTCVVIHFLLDPSFPLVLPVRAVPAGFHTITPLLHFKHQCVYIHESAILENNIYCKPGGFNKDL